MRTILLSFIAAVITATAIAGVHYLVNYSDDIHTIFHKADELYVVLIFLIVGAVFVTLRDK
jgi:hypothetical protein